MANTFGMKAPNAVELIDALQDAEGVLSLRDRSAAWEEERHRVMTKLRLVLIRSGWTVPERAKHLIEKAKSA